MWPVRCQSCPVDVRNPGVQPPCVALTAWWTLSEDPARASRKGTGRVLLIHAGRVVERGHQLILKKRKSGTEEPQAAPESLGERFTAPGQYRTSQSPTQMRRKRRASAGWRLADRPCGRVRALAANATISGRRMGSELLAELRLCIPPTPPDPATDKNAENRRNRWQESLALTRHQDLINDSGVPTAACHHQI